MVLSAILVYVGIWFVVIALCGLLVAFARHRRTTWNYLRLAEFTGSAITDPKSGRMMQTEGYRSQRLGDRRLRLEIRVHITDVPWPSLLIFEFSEQPGVTRGVRYKSTYSAFTIPREVARKMAVEVLKAVVPTISLAWWGTKLLPEEQNWKGN